MLFLINYPINPKINLEFFFAISYPPIPTNDNPNVFAASITKLQLLTLYLI